MVEGQFGAADVLVGLIIILSESDTGASNILYQCIVVFNTLDIMLVQCFALNSYDHIGNHGSHYYNYKYDSDNPPYYDLVWGGGFGYRLVDVLQHGLMLSFFFYDFVHLEWDHHLVIFLEVG